jgi:exosortase family protein XrtG
MSWPLAVILVALWVVTTALLHYYRVWIFYYLLATAGLAYLLVLVSSQVFDFESLLAHSVAFGVHKILLWVAIPSRIFAQAPGMLLVMVLTQRVGWTALQIGVESSSLLEMSVLTSLVLFYPEWPVGSRLRLALTGIALTWVANLLRMTLIAIMLHHMGKDALLLAHGVVGRIFFFGLTVGIYWLLITSRSLHTIEGRLATGEWAAQP